jgi:two-component system C4-dicarboxylate transport sensor histidine kinase DctB
VRVNRTTSALKSTLDRYESLPYLLGSHPYVQDLLAEPQRADLTARANRYLEDLNEHAHATVTYVVGADGLCVAASNWRAPDSFVGIEYRFRPYFIDAMNGRVASSASARSRAIPATTSRNRCGATAGSPASSS